MTMTWQELFRAAADTEQLISYDDDIDYKSNGAGKAVNKIDVHLRDCCLLFADEAEPTLFIEPKGINCFEVRNLLHLIMVSNSDWVIPAGLDARRFAMFEVAEHKKQDAEWVP